MKRVTLNGLQPRDSRELDHNPFDWTDAPLFEPAPRRMSIVQIALIWLAVLVALFSLAYKFAGPAS